MNEDSDNKNSGAMNHSDAVSYSTAVRESTAVRHSSAVSYSNAVSYSFGVYNCFGVCDSIFVAHRKMEPKIFKTLVSKDRYNEAIERLRAFNWHPEPTNVKKLYLQNGSKWESTPIHNAVEVSNADAWAEMPKEMLDYIRALPEFDAGVFEEITGIKGGCGAENQE